MTYVGWQAMIALRVTNRIAWEQLTSIASDGPPIDSCTGNGNSSFSD